MYRLYHKNGQGFKPAFFLMTHIRPLKKMCLLGNIQLIYIFHPRKKMYMCDTSCVEEGWERRWQINFKARTLIQPVKFYNLEI